MQDLRYMRHALSTLLLSPSPLPNFISLTEEGTELEPSPLNETRPAPHLQLLVTYVA
jgi:hypothetical protein